jgi:eukaryotic-like serine/threonine-protein kinase
MSLAAGTRLGPYEVLAPLGDGTEDRYKATDTRLNRVVTLKVLPSGVSSDPALKAKLDHDTQVISSLSHPQICAPVDVGHQDPSTDFLVTEYVEGETLTERLARGPIDVTEAVTLATFIADALNKAHRQGIAHGGLNPSVIVLTPSGPKLLDFGLAALKPEATALGGASLATTRTSVSTLASVPAVAAPYTSPEQFAGAAPDARSDIFAFGAILYQMLTGRPAFQEKTLALLIAAVQTLDPDPVTKLQPMAPPALDYLVRRCLTKDPKQRLQTALDLVNELKWVGEGSTKAGVPVPVAASRRKQERAILVALAVMSVLAVGLAPSVFPSFEPAPEPEAVRFPVPSMPTAIGTPLALSPDGRWLAASPGGAGASGVVALPLDAVTPQIIGRENNVTQPFWSPDSRSMAFYEEGRLKRVDVGGGPAQIICEAPPPHSVGTWNSDGVILFPGDRVIQRVLAAGGQPTPITTLDESKGENEHVAPVFLPDGRHFLFLAVSSQPGESGIYVGTLDSDKRTRLFASDSRALYARGSGHAGQGHLLFNRADTVFAQAFDADTLTLSGEPVRVASGVTLLAAGLNTSPAHARWAVFSVSQTGVFAYRAGGATTAATPGTDEPRTLFWVDRSGLRSQPVGTTGTYTGIDLSPDGKRVAVHRHEGAGGDTWFFDVAQPRMQRLTFDVSQDNSSPVWSPDGTQIAFGSQRSGRWGLYVKRADGSASEELIADSDTVAMPMSWSPDGKLLVYSNGGGNSVDLWAVPIAGDRKPFPLLQAAYPEAFGQVSPDGKWLAYTSGETARAEIYVKPFPDGPGKWQVSVDGGTFPRWRGDSKELYFYFNNNMFAADIRATGSSVEPGAPRTLFQLPNPSVAAPHPAYNRFAVSADGQRFLLSQPGAGAAATAAGGLSDVIIANVDRGGAAAGPGASVTPNAVSVVLNWTALLKQK